MDDNTEPMDAATHFTYTKCCNELLLLAFLYSNEPELSKIISAASKKIAKMLKDKGPIETIH
jgi:hypothetical protein